MSDEIEKLSDEEIIRRQSELYELEFQAGGALAGRLGTPEEQMEKIKAFFAPDYFDKLNALIEAKKQELRQKILNNKNPKEKENLERLLRLVIEVNKETLRNNYHQKNETRL